VAVGEMNRFGAATMLQQEVSRRCPYLAADVTEETIAADNQRYLMGKARQTGGEPCDDSAHGAWLEGVLVLKDRTSYCEHEFRYHVEAHRHQPKQAGVGSEYWPGGIVKAHGLRT
jgi:hypothetical protein